MDATADSTIPKSPGKTAFWGNSRAPHKVAGVDSQPASTQPSTIGISSLDNVRTVFWQAYRHLFPPHALAAQTGNGSIVISWSVADDPHAVHPYAAPVVLRFEKQLVDRMWQVQPAGRMRIAQEHEPTLREGLRGYDPFTRFPNARVVCIG
jgi:hypothetical protein